jgi:hypothetical protein
VIDTGDFDTGGLVLAFLWLLLLITISTSSR